MAEQESQQPQAEPRSMREYSANLSASLSGFYAKPVAKISLEMFFSLTLVIVLAVFAIKPTLGTIAQLRTEIEQKEELVGRLQSKNNTLQSAKQQYAQEEVNIELLSQALPPTADLIPALKTVEKIATDTNVIMRSASVRQIPDETSELQTAQDAQKLNLPISTTIVGNYADIRRFVETLDNSRRTFDVVSINFSVEESRDSQLLQATISINAPYFGIPQ